MVLINTDSIEDAIKLIRNINFLFRKISDEQKKEVSI